MCQNRAKTKISKKPKEDRKYKDTHLEISNGVHVSVTSNTLLVKGGVKTSP